jgi:hypothetical protein
MASQADVDDTYAFAQNSLKLIRVAWSAGAMGIAVSCNDDRGA